MNIGGDMPMQSEGELEAHYGLGGPVQAACDFVEAFILLDEPERAWAVASPELRQELAAEDLPARWSKLGLDRSAYESGRWGYLSRPRPVGPNRELVLLVQGRLGEIIDRIDWRPAVPFVVELHEGMARCQSHRPARPRGFGWAHPLRITRHGAPPSTRHPFRGSRTTRALLPTRERD